MAKIARVEEFESLRGMLALWVVVNHVILAAGLYSDHWQFPLNLLGKGRLAVDVFIILSGFVIFCLLDTANETYRQFMVRRAFRLFPVYWVCLAISIWMVPMSMESLSALQWQHAHNAVRLKIFSDSIEHWWLHLLAHLTLLHGAVPNSVLPSSDYAFIGQAWSISLEWQFYITAPLCYSIVARHKLSYTLVFIATLILVHRFFRAGDGFLANNIDLFFLGAISYFAYKFAVRNRELLDAYSTMLAVVPFVLAVLFVRTIPVVLFSAVYSLILGRALLPSSKIVALCSTAMTLRPIAYLGKISYSIYMSHMIILYLCMYCLIPFRLTQQEFFWVVLVLVMSSTIAVSAVLSRYIEYPLMGYGRTLAGRYGASVLSSKS